MKQKFQVLFLALSIVAALVSCKEKPLSENDPGFYIAVTSLDEWGNESAISNVVFNEEVMAPAAVASIDAANPFIKTRYNINRSSCQRIDGATPNVLRIKLKPGSRAALSGVNNSRLGVSSVDALTSMYPGARFQRMITSGPKTEARHKAAGLDLWYYVIFDSQSTPDLRTAISQYDALDDVQYVETVRPMVISEADLGTRNISAPVTSMPASRAAEMPFNDPQLKMQWHYDNMGVSYDGVKEVNPRANINLFKAWQKSTGDKDVIVAVVDQGIDYNHEDLKDAMWVNEGEIPDNKIDDDGNGFVDDVYGYNFSPKMAEDGSWLSPPYVHTGKIEPGSHGTHVAGTVGAINNNGKGVCGVAGGSDGTGGVRIMCVEIFGATGNADGSLIADAIVYSADNGAVISQNSWNMTEDEWSASIEEAYTYFVTNAGNKEMFPNSPMVGGVVFVSAGNSNNNLIGVPANYKLSVTVAAINHLRAKSDHSNFGGTVALAAPGGNFGGGTYLDSEVLGVYSTDLNNGYVGKSGTSMASPHVSGLAALYISQNKGNVTPEQVKARVLSSCVDLSDTDPNYKFMGRGLIDGGKVLRVNDNSGPKAITNLAIIKTGTDFVLSWTVPSDDNDVVSSYKVYFSKTPITESSIANLKHSKGLYTEEVGKNQKHVIK